MPLPVFFSPEGETILDAKVARKVADLVESEGTNIWFELGDEELAKRLGLPEGTSKCRDTLDVWIDSGTSHVAVLDRHPELHCPADLYLEATDQHRGWFQSSLLLSVGVRDAAPYKTVMTHGFVVDQDTRKKTSKSDDKKKGKPTDASYFYNKYGADILRLWVSSVDWQTEVPFGEGLFKQVAEPYRRLRNTLRILLGNLNGFDAASDTACRHRRPTGSSSSTRRRGATRISRLSSTAWRSASARPNHIIGASPASACPWCSTGVAGCSSLPRLHGPARSV